MKTLAVVCMTVFMVVTVRADTQPACTQLTSLQLPDVKILSAVEVAAEETLPAHCSVLGVIGKETNFELLLPDDWNGRFAMGGGGGFVGSIQNAVRNQALERGYATVGTDTGHQGTGIQAGWALDNLERKLNFGYMAVHLTAEVAKAIVREYYETEIDYSYFLGCSRGGGQAMMESQRYPADFDGIVAGAPAYHWSGIGAGFLQTQQAIYPDPNDLSHPVITPENRAFLHEEILRRCDGSDGITDGVMDDPRTCTFSIDDLPLCPDDSPAPVCFTKGQIAAIRSIYEGPQNEAGLIYPGFPTGGENDAGGWDTWITGRENAFGIDVPSLHYAFGTEMYKYLMFDNPDWKYAEYDFSNYAEDTAFGASYLNATKTDLSTFRDLGGKMILWQGWSDAAITALGTIAYYEDVEAEDEAVRDYFRLFLMPGVLHCGGGPGPDQVDFLSAIEDWVENGEAPERLLASKVGENQAIQRTRPLCPYPQRAVYNGSGNTDEAANFTCRTP